MLTNGSIALIGETGAGKTTQIGQLAKAIKKLTGKDTVLATCDRGGQDTIEHLIDLDVIKRERFSFAPDDDIHVWINHVAQGETFDAERKLWVNRTNKDGIGLWVFESGSSMGEECLNKLARDQAEGKSIGGKSSFNVQLGDGKRIASNTESHYGVIQTFLREKIWQSQQLPGIVLWTFALDKDENTSGQVMLGPRLAGHAMTTMIPRWFRYTFRIDAVPQQEAAPKHVLYLQAHTNGQLSSYGNARVPLEGYNDLPLTIEPASLPEALERIQALRDKAKELTREELGL